jgi:hypothetical protein
MSLFACIYIIGMDTEQGGNVMQCPHYNRSGRVSLLSTLNLGTRILEFFKKIFYKIFDYPT